MELEDSESQDMFFCVKCGCQFTDAEFGSLEVASNQPVCQSCYEKWANKEW